MRQLLHCHPTITEVQLDLYAHQGAVLQHALRAQLSSGAEVVLGALVESAADASSHRKVQAQASIQISLPRIIRVMQDCAEQLEFAFHN